MNNLLFDESPLLASRELATKIGLNEVIILQYLYCLQEKNRDWFIMTSDKFMQVFPFWSDSTIKRIVDNLVQKNIIIKETQDCHKIEQRLKNKNMAGLGEGNNVCDWCKVKTIFLHRHHYPILKSQGGIKVVSICPNCHSEFHGLINKYKINQNLIEIITLLKEAKLNKEKIYG